jgi:hypothetical protein
MESKANPTRKSGPPFGSGRRTGAVFLAAVGNGVLVVALINGGDARLLMMTLATLLFFLVVLVVPNLLEIVKVLALSVPLTGVLLFAWLVFDLWLHPIRIGPPNSRRPVIDFTAETNRERAAERNSDGGVP